MKKLFLTISILGAIATTAVAQNDRKGGSKSQPEMTVEQRAEKQTSKVSSALSLSETQKTTFKKLCTERLTANKALRDKAKASTDQTEKKSLHEQVKANNEKFFTTVNAMLTPEQQTKWADHKKKMQDKKDDHND